MAPFWRQFNAANRRNFRHQALKYRPKTSMNQRNIAKYISANLAGLCRCTILNFACRFMKYSDIHHGNFQFFLCISPHRQIILYKVPSLLLDNICAYSFNISLKMHHFQPCGAKSRVDNWLWVYLNYSMPSLL